MTSRFNRLYLACCLTGLSLFLCSPTLAQAQVSESKEYRQYLSNQYRFDKEVYGKFFIVNNLLNRMPSANIEKLAVYYVMRLEESNPKMTPQLANRIGRDFVTAYLTSYGNQENVGVSQTIKNVNDLIKLGKGASSLMGKIDLGLAVFSEYEKMEQAQRNQLALSYFSSVMNRDSSPSAIGVRDALMNREGLRVAIEHALADNRVGDALDQFLGDKVGGLSLRKDAFIKWCLKNPDIADQLSVTMKEALEGGVVSNETLVKIVSTLASKGELDKCKQRADEALRQTKKLQGLPQEAQRKARAEIIMESYAPAFAGLDLIGSMFAMADPKFGKEFVGVMRTAVEFGQLGTLIANKAISENLALSSGIGIVTSLFQIIASGPSPEQLILEQIVELRKEVHELHMDMIAQFREVHEHLHQIEQYLAGKLGELKEDIRNIHPASAKIQDQIALLPTAMREFTNAQRGRELTGKINE